MDRQSSLILIVLVLLLIIKNSLCVWAFTKFLRQKREEILFYAKIFLFQHRLNRRNWLRLYSFFKNIKLTWNTSNACLFPNCSVTKEKENPFFCHSCSLLIFKQDLWVSRFSSELCAVRVKMCIKMLMVKGKEVFYPQTRDEAFFLSLKLIDCQQQCSVLSSI